MADMNVTLKARGLNVSPNSLESADGSLTEARNVNIRRDDVLEPRRGLKPVLEKTTPTTPYDLAYGIYSQLQVYKKRFFLARGKDAADPDNLDVDFKWFPADFSSENTITNNTYHTNVKAPAKNHKPRMLEFNSNLYLTTDKDVMKFSSKDYDGTGGDYSKSQLQIAGIPRAWNIDASLSITAGDISSFLPADSVTSYKVTWAAKDKLGNLVEGPASPATTIGHSMIQTLWYDFNQVILALMNTQKSAHAFYGSKWKLPGVTPATDYVSQTNPLLNAVFTDLIGGVSSGASELVTALSGGDLGFSSSSDGLSKRLDLATFVPASIDATNGVVWANNIATIKLTTPLAYTIVSGDTIAVFGNSATNGSYNGKYTVLSVDNPNAPQTLKVTSADRGVSDASTTNGYLQKVVFQAIENAMPTDLLVGASATNDQLTTIQSYLQSVVDSLKAVLNTATVNYFNRITLTKSAKVKLKFRIPKFIQELQNNANYFYRIYRSSVNQAVGSNTYSNLVPQTDYKLIYESSVIDPVTIKYADVASVASANVTSYNGSTITRTRINVNGINIAKVGDRVWNPRIGGFLVEEVGSDFFICTGAVPYDTNLYVTSSEVVDGDFSTVSYLDSQPTSPNAPELYENTEEPNYPPPSAVDIHSYNGYTFYLNTKLKHTTNSLQYLGTDNVESFVVTTILPGAGTPGQPVQTTFILESSSQGKFAVGDFVQLIGYHTRTPGVSLVPGVWRVVATPTTTRITLEADATILNSAVVSYTPDVRLVVSKNVLSFNSIAYTETYPIVSAKEERYKTTLTTVPVNNDQYIAISGTSKDYIFWFNLNSASMPASLEAELNTYFPTREVVEIKVGDVDNTTFESVVASHMHARIFDFKRALGADEAYSYLTGFVPATVNVTSTLTISPFNLTAYENGRGRGANRFVREIAFSGQSSSPSVNTDELASQTVSSVCDWALRSTDTRVVGHYVGSVGLMLFEGDRFADAFYFTGSYGLGNLVIQTSSGITAEPEFTVSISGTTLTTIDKTTGLATAHGFGSNGTVIECLLSYVANGSGGTSNYPVIATVASSTTLTVGSAITDAYATISRLRTDQKTISIITDNFKKPNRLYFSKFEQAEHVPLSNYIDFGPEDKAGLRIFATRDSLFIFKEDGLYRLSGEIAPFSYSIFDLSCVLWVPNSVDINNNLIYAWTSQGIVTVSEGGVNIISRPIDTELLKISAQRDFAAYAWGMSYEADNSFYIFTFQPNAEYVRNDSQPYLRYRWNKYQGYRFSNLTSSWTTINLDREQFLSTPDLTQVGPSYTGTILETNQHLMYLAKCENIQPASVSVSQILEERKNFDRYDHCDDEYSNGILSTVLNSNATRFYITGMSSRDRSKVRVGDSMELQATSGVDPAELTVKKAVIIRYTMNAGGAGIDLVEVEYDPGSAKFVLNDAVVIYQAIECRIKYTPNTLGDSRMLKHLREVTVMPSSRSFHAMDIEVSSDLNPTPSTVEFKGDGSIAYYDDSGSFSDTLIPTLNNAPFRTYVPRIMQRCRFLNLKIKANVAAERMQIYGVTILGNGDAQSPRGYK